ncbi:hypothetical protein [Amycolatopsis sp. WQ 127309]|nr:hypothetical protein [Amycolatopsis sp. WQ 127309]
MVTDRQAGQLLGLSRTTTTRHRRRAFEQQAEAAAEYSGQDLP